MKRQLKFLAIGILGLFLASSVCLASPGVDKDPVPKEALYKVTKVSTPVIFTVATITVSDIVYSITTDQNSITAALQEIASSTLKKQPLLEHRCRWQVNDQTFATTPTAEDNFKQARVKS